MGRSPFQVTAQGAGRLAMPDQRWWIYPALKGEAQGLAQQLGISPLLAQVLLNRGVEDPASAVDFLQPENLLLPSPLDEFPDLAQSVDILVQAISFQEKIAICGDYDADGMTSTALLLRALRFLGAQVTHAIPSRMQEGYGINRRIVEEFATEGVSIILTVDNGIAAVDPIAYARELGLTVIVTDHHDVPPQIPPAHAILNPKLIAETSPYRGVAGVGVAYILAVCLAQALGKTQALTAPLLELFTLGTIADLAPLTGVNRRWVRRGLGLLSKSRILGIQKLIEVAGLEASNETLRPEDIGFKLGPRINAVGRIGDPQVVIDLLTTDDPAIALERATQCEQANQHRQEWCNRIETEAVAWIEAQQAEGGVDLLRDRVLLVIHPHWHHGVIGIVASRLVERYGVPVFIATYEDEEQKEIRGSARGIPEFNVFEALQSCHDLLTKFGGHPAAGGFSFPAKHLRQVKSRLVKFANETLRPEHLKPLVMVDVRAHLRDLTADLYTQINALQPCGIGNPDPVFWTANVRVVEQRAIGQTKAHLKLRLAEEDGVSMEAIAWRWGEYCPLPDRLDVAYKLSLNEWQGTRTLQLELVGVRPASLPPSTKSGTARQTGVPPTAEMVPPPSAPAHIPLGDMAPAPENAAPSPPEAGWVNFMFSNRPYQAQVLQQGEARELQIHNGDGHALVVLLPERKGYLWIPGENAQLVNLAEPGYANLIQAALDAIALRQKDHLLQEQARVIAEKDRQIAALTEQLATLNMQLRRLEVPMAPTHPPVSPSSPAPPQSLESPWQPEASIFEVPVPPPSRAEPAAVRASAPSVDARPKLSRKAAGKSAPTSSPKQTQKPAQAAAIARPGKQTQVTSAPALPTTQIQTQGMVHLPAPDLTLLQQGARAAVGDKVWFCLNGDSQEDLNEAYRQWHLRLSAGDDSASYGEAGLRLGTVVEREVLYPWLEDLSAFLENQGRDRLGSVSFGEESFYRLSMAAPLLATEWVALQSSALPSDTPPHPDHLYTITRPPNPLSDRDRTLLDTFLTQWEHPLSTWLRQDPPTVAAQLDQISSLHSFAGNPKHPFPAWAWALLHQLVIGSAAAPGILRQIYGP